LLFLAIPQASSTTLFDKNFLLDEEIIGKGKSTVKEKNRNKSEGKKGGIFVDYDLICSVLFRMVF